MDIQNNSPYNYKFWINSALLEVVKRTIKTIEYKGLYKDIHFFITFNTKHSLVKLPTFLKAKYPNTITIVLQNQFYDLQTDALGFSIKLYFSSKLTELFIPWHSITQILDPVTPFSLNIAPLNEADVKPIKHNNIIKFPKQD